MTNKEAIDILEKEREEYIVKGCKLDRALEVAIKALSVEAARVNGNLVNKRDAIEAVICHIWHMPNEAYRQFNCENIVREVVEDAIKRLPSASEQSRQRGEWVPNHIPDSMLCECDQCGFDCGAYAFNFCPNCGADMRRGGEEE